MRLATPIWWRLRAADSPAIPPPTMITCMPDTFRDRSRSVRRNPGFADDRTVAPVIGRDQVAELIPAGETEIVAERRQSLLQVGEPGDLGELLLQPSGEFARRPGRSRDAEPDADVEPGQRVLADRRHLRKQGNAL